MKHLPLFCTPPMKRWSHAAAWVGILAVTVVADTIPPSQTFIPAWASAGLTLDEIPFPRQIVNVRDFGALGNGVSNDYAAFNSAITSLNSRAGVVFVPAGNYFLRSGLTLKSGTILRGQSPTNTTLTFSTNFYTQCINISGSGFGAFQSIASGATQFSSQVTVTNAGVLSTGKYVVVRMYEPGSWGLSTWGTNSIGQIARVSAIAGNVITLDQPLRLNYSAYTPQIAPFNNPMTNAGIENLRITRELIGGLPGTADNRDNMFTIRIAYAANCWVRGCDLYKCFGAHIGLEYATHNEIRGNYFQEAHEYDGGGSGYGVRYEYLACQNLTENNIFRKLRHSMLNQIGANANVWGYNYSRDGRDDWGFQTSDITTHGNYPFANLAEGNICSFISLDNSHGWNGPYCTFFRNKATHSYGISDESTCRNEAYVGNETAGAFDPATSRGFCYGNTKSSGFVAATSQPWSNLWDYSYYLTTNPMAPPPRPDWWVIAQSHLYPIGPTNGNNYSATKYIPAKSRYDAGGTLTFAPPSVDLLPPETIAARAGSSVTLDANAYGTPSVAYAWFKNGVALPGATNASLSLNDISASDQALYTVSFTDNGGSLTSPPTALYLIDGTLNWTNDHGFLDVPANWDPPVGPPDSTLTGRIEAAGAPIEAVFRANLPLTPAALILGTGGVLTLNASMTSEHRLTLNGGRVQAGTGNVTIATTAALAAPSTVGSAGPNLALKWTLSDHASAAGRLVVSNSGAGSVSVYSGGSTYSGGTEVRQGDMLVYSNDATGTGPVDVMPGGVFKPALATLIQTNPVVLRGGQVIPHITSVLRAPIRMGADSAIGTTNASVLSVHGPITDAADGTGRLIVSNSGAGTVRFYCANSTYGGGTVVQMGILQLYSNNATGSGAVEVMPDGTVQMAATTVQSAPVRLKGGRLYAAANYTLNAPVEVWSDSILDSIAASTVALLGPVRDADASHAGRLTKRGTGYMALAGGTNTFSGGLEVREGTLACTVSGSLGSGNVDVLAGAVLILSSSNASHGASVITIQSNATVQLSTSYTTNIVVRPGGTVRGGTGNINTYDRLRIEGDVLFQRQSGSGYVNLRGPIFDGASPGRFILATTNGFPVTFCATNQYTGGTRLTDGGTGKVGELTLAAGGSLPDTGTVTLESNSVLNLNAISDTVGSLEGFGEVKFGATAATRLTVTDGRATVFAGTISGTGGLVRAGTGSLTLAGSNLWTGVTIVTGGLLRVDSILNNGPVTAYSNGFLGGTGTIGASVTLRAGAGFDWGQTPGVLTITTNLVFPTGGVMRLSFDAQRSSRVVVQGRLSLPSSAEISLVSLPGGGTGADKTTVFTASSIAGPAALSGWTIRNNVGYRLSLTTNEVMLIRDPPTGLILMMR